MAINPLYKFSDFNINNQSPVSANQVRLLDEGKLDKVDVTATDQFMGYQVNGRDVYQKYVTDNKANIRGAAVEAFDWIAIGLKP